MPLFMNVGEYTYEEVAEVAQNFPELKLVLLRPGLNRSRVTFPLLRKTKNVYFDISVMLDTGLLTEVVSKFGPERFLYSSCLPRYLGHPAPFGQHLHEPRLDRRGDRREDRKDQRCSGSISFPKITRDCRLRQSLFA